MIGFVYNILLITLKHKKPTSCVGFYGGNCLHQPSANLPLQIRSTLSLRQSPISGDPCPSRLQLQCREQTTYELGRNANRVHINRRLQPVKHLQRSDDHIAGKERPDHKTLANNSEM